MNSEQFIDATRKKLKELVDEINNAKIGEQILVGQQNVAKEHLSIIKEIQRHQDGRIWIQPKVQGAQGYDVSVSGQYLTKQLCPFMRKLFGRECNGYKNQQQPFWHTADFAQVEKVIWQYAKKVIDARSNESGDQEPAKAGKCNTEELRDKTPTSNVSEDGKRLEWLALDRAPEHALPEEIAHPDLYVEGAKRVGTVNAYERDPKARKKCIEHHGCQCAVCAFDFEATYGSIGEGYIHVHHIKPLSEMQGKYVLDPVADLIPVCPNCHAMIHKETPVLTVEKLKQLRK